MATPRVKVKQKRFVVDGEPMSLREVCEKFDLKVSFVESRAKVAQTHGLDFSDVIKMPFGSKFAKKANPSDDGTAIRTCIKCRREFRSVSKANRICSHCGAFGDRMRNDKWLYHC